MLPKVAEITVLRFLRDLLLPRPAIPAEPNLVLITRPEHDVPGEVKIIRRLFAAGLGRLHLRKPSWSSRDHTDFLDAIPDIFWPRIVFYAYPEIVLARGLGGFHLKTGESTPRNWPEQRPVSSSSHSYDELMEGPRRRQYSVLGPVFPSISKKNQVPHRTHREFEVILQRWRSEGGCPVYALGGVTPETATIAREIGFDGVAFIGCVWESENPVKTFLDLERAWLGEEPARLKKKKS